MKRYRTAMTIVIDVLADCPHAAMLLAEDYYFDSDHFWNPDSTVEIPEDDTDFSPINDPDDYI